MVLSQSLQNKLMILLLSVLFLSACNDKERQTSNELNSSDLSEVEETNSELYEVEGEETNELYLIGFETLTIEVKERDVSKGNFKVDLQNLKEEYELKEGVKVEVIDYFPSFEFKEGVPVTKSSYPLDPGFIFKISNNEFEEIIFISIANKINAYDDAIYDMKFVDVTTTKITLEAPNFNDKTADWEKEYFKEFNRLMTEYEKFAGGLESEATDWEKEYFKEFNRLMTEYEKFAGGLENEATDWEKEYFKEFDRLMTEYEKSLE